MATSEINIASNAIIRLGGEPISSFSDGGAPGGNKHGVIAGNLWPEVRDAALRSHPWNCAVKRVKLAPMTEKPAFGYSNQFALPGDWLRVLDINDNQQYDPDFRVETYGSTRVLLVSKESVNLRYIYRNEDVSKWDSMLVIATELMMAVAMCYPVTLSFQLRNDLRAELDGVLRQARAINGQEEAQQQFGDFPLLESRYASRSGKFDHWRGE